MEGKQVAMTTRETIEALREQDYIRLTGDIIDLYREHNALRITQVASLLDIDRRTAAVRLRILLINGLVRWTRHGYKKTPTLIEYLVS